MSTEYYRPRRPITSVRLEEGPAHDCLFIWERGALAGKLVLTKGSGLDVARLLFQDEPTIQASSNGLALNDFPQFADLSDGAQLLDENGRFTTAGELRAKWKGFA